MSKKKKGIRRVSRLASVLQAPFDRSRLVRQKVARLNSGGKPRVLDLFAGCGGLSLGFHASGYEIAAAIESDPDAAQSHGFNFHPRRPEHARGRDITKTSPEKLTAELNLGLPETAFDVIVGGP